MKALAMGLTLNNQTDVHNNMHAASVLAAMNSIGVANYDEAYWPMDDSHLASDWVDQLPIQSVKLADYDCIVLNGQISARFVEPYTMYHERYLYCLNVLKTFDGPIYYVANDLRYKFVEVLYELAGQGITLYVVTPFEGAIPWLKHIGLANKHVGIGTNFMHNMHSIMPMPFFTPCKYHKYDITFASNELDMVQKAILEKYCSNVQVAGIGKNQPGLQSITGGCKVGTTQLYTLINRSAGQILAYTPMHFALGLHYNERFWQALLWGSHMLVPIEYKLIVEGTPAETYCVVQSANHVCAKLARYKADANYRQEYTEAMQQTLILLRARQWQTY